MKIGTENEKLEFKKTTAELREGVISMADRISVSLTRINRCHRLSWKII